MNYISKVFSPRVNLTRIDSEEIAEVIPPTNFKNLIMEQNEANHTFTRPQGTADVDLNNIDDPPSGVRNKIKNDTDGSKSSTINFMIHIPDGRNTKLQDAPHTESTTKTPKGKDCYTVYINYQQEAFNTNEFLLCKETLEHFAVIKGPALETNLFASNEEMDLNRLHEFPSGVVSRKQTDTRRQMPMDFEERRNLMESRTSTYCSMIKTIQVFNSIISTNPANAQQFQSDLQTRLESIYAKINEIDTQFSKDDANREHYNLASLEKPQVQPTDKEINQEYITTLLKHLDAETEAIKHQMKSTMKANGQTDSKSMQTLNEWTHLHPLWN